MGLRARGLMAKGLMAKGLMAKGLMAEDSAVMISPKSGSQSVGGDCSLEGTIKPQLCA